jgi:cysteine synthase
MPETMSLERRQILFVLGAKIILSEGSKGMDGAEDLAHEIVQNNPEKYFMPNQFANQANVLAHYETTGEEIWRDTKGKVTHFLTGIGKFMKYLQRMQKKLQDLSPLLKVFL